MGMVKIGVLGGTFDPIHNGHIRLAEEAMSRLNLEQVLFIPAGQPRFKVDNDISAAEHRVEMVRLAIAGRPCFKLSIMEVERPGPSYTVDTMTELQAQYGAEVELFFLLGWDTLAQLPQWKEPSRLIKLCRLVAVPRPGYALPDLAVMEGVIPGISRRVIVLDRPEVDISATGLRQRAIRGLSLSHLVPEPVVDYIREHGLYST